MKFEWKCHHNYTNIHIRRAKPQPQQDATQKQIRFQIASVYIMFQCY